MAYAETSAPPSMAVSASGKKGSALPKGAVCTSVTITPSENGGFTVEHRYRAPKTSGKSYPDYIEPRDFTFESEASMLAHVKTAFK